MTESWHFREFKPGDNASDPDFAKALFSKGSSGVLPRAIVREAIQNSLDARASKAGAAKVRFTLRTGHNSADSSQAKLFFEGIWAHLLASNAGLAAPPNLTAPIPFLTVEDFGTAGLRGDPAQWAPFGSEKNPFFLFFRALGRSGKEGEDRGRWGVGKFVFPLASRASCWFGLTVPTGSTTPLLMGRVVLKTHGTQALSFHPDGHWGRKATGNALVLPSEDPASLSKFRKVFGVVRNSEPGLTVVIPWVSAEVDGAALLRAVMSEYFLPVLRRELEVVVDDDGDISEISAATFDSHLSQIQDPAVHDRIALALRIHEWTAADMEILPIAIPYDEMDWDESLLGEELAAKLSLKLESGEPIGVRVPVSIKPKSGIVANTHFDVFIQRTDSAARQRPLIVREGITITEEKTSQLQGMTALVIIDDGALAGLVGDAESPAHNELQYQLIKDKYLYAGKVLSLIRTAPSSVIRTLERQAREDDPLMLAHFFPQSSDEDKPKNGLPKPRKSAGTKPEAPPEIPPGRIPRIRMSRVDGGFIVKGNPAAPTVAEEVAIRFAYEVRRGNPFKKYNALDFSLLRGDVSLELEGAELISQSDNRVTLRPLVAEFYCAITGFDAFRNVIVRADAE